MGFFSWKTSDTGRPITNKYSNKGTFPVYLLRPDGVYIQEDNYAGYGVFDGHDVFMLLAQWNEPEWCEDLFYQAGTDPEKNAEINDRMRLKGIDLADEPNIPYPLVFVEKLPHPDRQGRYDRNKFPRSEPDPNQGYFD